MTNQCATEGDITMKKNLSASNLVTLVLSLVTFLWLLFHLNEIRTDLPGVLRFDLSDYSDILMAMGYLVMLLFHAAAFIFIFKESRFTNRFGGRKVLMLILGIVSLVAIAMEKVMYDEIAHELSVEYPVPSEVFLLYGCLVVNALFCIVIMLAAYRALAQAPAPAAMPRDERMFTIAQVMGIASGIVGIILTLSVIGRRTPSERFWIYIPFYLLFLMPYALAVLYWLVLKRRERATDWYDEKQVRDVLKGSFTALLLSVPGLFILALVRRPLGFYWFPYYLFLILSLFSVSTLYFFKRE